MLVLFPAITSVSQPAQQFPKTSHIVRAEITKVSKKIDIAGNLSISRDDQTRPTGIIRIKNKIL